MPKWIKKILKPKPRPPEAPLDEQIAAVLNRSKKFLREELLNIKVRIKSK